GHDIPVQSMTHPDCSAACPEWNGVLGIEKKVDALLLDDLRNGELIPGEDRPAGHDDFFHARFPGVGAYECRIPVEQNEVVPRPEVEQGSQQALGVDPDSTAVLVIVPQHDANAHVSTP